SDAAIGQVWSPPTDFLIHGLIQSSRVATRFEPMRLTRRIEPFDHPDWIFELKLDGFRALAHVDHGKGDLVSRNRNTFASFRNLAAEIAGAFRGVRRDSGRRL